MPETRRRTRPNRIIRRRIQGVAPRSRVVIRPARAASEWLTRHRCSLASWAMVAGITGLALTALVAAAAAVATFVDNFLAGIVLGAGLVVTGWTVSRSRRRLVERRQGSPGRIRTSDCHRSRWDRPVIFDGAPRPPAPADRRVRPCPGSRRY
jgi:hypothetical protein